MQQIKNIKTWTGRREMLMGLFVVLAAAAATLWFLPPPAGAVDCGNGSSHPVSYEWLITPLSIQHTNDGYCGPNEVCRQWCFVSCDEVTPQPDFECFPE